MHNSVLINDSIHLQSPINAETGSAHDETSSSGNKEDEDDDDDESDDKIDTQTHDPERLKAFNVSGILLLDIKIIVSLVFFH